jgi:hypothetical protein
MRFSSNRSASLRPALIATALAGLLASVGAQASVSYSTDFESPTAMTEDNWRFAVNYFTPDCATYQSSPYGDAAPDNGPQISALAHGASSQVANIYSNYDDPAHTTTCLETNVYQEVTLEAGDEGDYTFSYDVEFPPEEFRATKANGYVRVFAPGFSSVLLSVAAPSDAEGSKEIAVTLTAEMAAGGILQFGFNNYAYSYESSGMYYDNASFTMDEPEEPGPPPEPPGFAESVPTLDTLGKLALLLALGVMGMVVLNRRGL